MWRDDKNFRFRLTSGHVADVAAMSRFVPLDNSQIFDNHEFDDQNYDGLLAPQT
jgi:hypothetical protein